jgi:hypothetical protein
MILLSFSTLNMVYTASHNWLNKQMGIKPEERPEWREGKLAHDLIQKHVSGKQAHPYLTHIKLQFPIVEECDLDPRCRFEFPIDSTGYKYKYGMIGFFDGINEEENRMLEIKASFAPWSIGKFHKLMQRKVYALAKPLVTEMICVTGLRNPDLWKDTPPKVYRIPMTEADREEAIDWIYGGIQIIESGDYTGGLVDGRCENPYCYFGKNCQFKE